MAKLSSTDLLRCLKSDDAQFSATDADDFSFPGYDPKRHYLDLTRSKYYQALGVLRHYVREVSNYYWGYVQQSKNIDLFMLTPSVSSPMGPGSDSEVIQIEFGGVRSYLVDSSQFGFEPLLLNGLSSVYCYLPSMRGEDPDSRHLNQFFHCEAEISGELSTLIPQIEEYIKMLSATLSEMPNIIERISSEPNASFEALENILETETFPSITFDEAVNVLCKNGHEKLVKHTTSGRDLSAEGEIALASVFNFQTPFWIRNYDRDRVPFYQKPSRENLDRVINADLIFPSIIKQSFGGEIVGCGQRQDDVEEMFESLNRQKIDPAPYEWYMNLRRLPEYRTTSGFGLGIERFIAWALGRSDIKECIFYPRLKGTVMYP